MKRLPAQTSGGNSSGSGDRVATYGGEQLQMDGTAEEDGHVEMQVVDEEVLRPRTLPVPELPSLKGDLGT